MKRVVLPLIVVLATSGCSKKLFDNGTLFDLDSGSKAARTAAFNARTAWDLTYSYDCSKQHAVGLKDLDRFDLLFYNSDDDSYASEDPHIHLLGAKGKATVHRKVPGWYYLTVDSPCDWKLSAESVK